MNFTFAKRTVGMILILQLLAGDAYAGEMLDDATIFAIFDETNTADVWAGRIAVARAHSDAVRELGEMVATEHEAVQQSWRDLARKLGVIPKPPQNDTRAEALAKTVAQLQAKSGTEFDTVYLRHEMAFHQDVIDAIKGRLLPAIRNEQFRALVSKALPAFEHHLAETRSVAKALGVEP